ncbi:MAG: ABC transporter ATP-binding protein [Pseudomonadota bacterium]
MIRFEKLSKGFWANGVRKQVIDSLNLTLPAGRSLALMGRNGAGKSTLLQLISGTLKPDAGRIISDGTISWTVGFSGSFHPDLTGVQNVRFIARVYGVDTDALVDFVQDFADIGPHFYEPVRSYSAGMRSRLAFGASMGIRFDTYLVDEVTAVGDQQFRRKSRRVFLERMQESSAILVSHNMPDILDFCDEGLVLENGKVTHFRDLNEAIAYHRDLMAD